MPYLTNKLTKEEDRLIAFFYLLMRDHLPSGTVHEIIKQHILLLKDNDPVFSNPWVNIDAQMCLKAITEARSWKEINEEYTSKILKETN